MNDRDKAALAPPVPADPDATPPIELVAVHYQLTQQLATLDRVGEHIAAAHLLAAIDAIEDRLDTSGGDRAPGQGSRIELLTRNIVDRFGDRALDVSREQLGRASGTTHVVWAAITNRLQTR